MLNRQIYDLNSLADLLPETVNEPVRFSFKSPLLGGPPLREIRAALSRYGRVRFSGTTERLNADFDPGEQELPLLALDMIVRDDSQGLERAILSAMGQVDQIVVGVDGRSKDDTLKVAEAYADIAHVFQAAEIGLTDEQWAANRIHFANARNKGRALVTTPFVLVIDSDEYLERSCDLRTVIRTRNADQYSLISQHNDFRQTDHQRFARAEFRWANETHNALNLGEITGETLTDTVIVQDTSLRDEKLIALRHQQRDAGIDRMEEAAKKGDLHALFHVIKHRAGKREATAPEIAAMVQDYRSRAEVHGPLAEERGFLAWVAAILAHNAGNSMESELWAFRALLDGPRLDVFLLLSVLAEERGELVDALFWIETACLITDEPKHGWPKDAQFRFVRRSSLRQAIGRAVAAGEVELPDGAQQPAG